MLKQLNTNEHGIVFVTVLILVIVAMILAMTALSLNLSQVKSTENELKHIQAGLLAEGAFSELFTNQFTGTPGTSMSYTEQLGNTTFTITSQIDGSGSGPAGSESVPMTIDVSF